MRRAAIFSADLIASTMIVAWYVWGPWIDLYGFSVYHSRGDVWLPIPPGARSFLAGMVSIEACVFASLFALASCLILLFGSALGAGDADGGSYFRDALYGDGRKLLAKYLAFFVASIILPFATSAMWKYRGSRELAISSALGIAVAAFLIVIFLADLMLGYALSVRSRVRV